MSMLFCAIELVAVTQVIDLGTFDQGLQQTACSAFGPVRLALLF